MASTVRWGVLGVAGIAVNKVIPAMRQAAGSQVVAIASRDLSKARRAADDLGIPAAYGSYRELIDDPHIDAIYNPLPNHLHREWTIAAAERGKHVLCEKPIGMNAREAGEILAVRDRTGVTIQEAFMVRTHPQWERTVEICRSGGIGKVRSYVGVFSYYNDDPSNIRNIAEAGGGALMDIGCYLLTTSRMVFGEEPARVIGIVDRDPVAGVDTLTSMMIDFPSGHALGTCATRVLPYQRVQVIGTAGRIEIEIPFNAPNDRPCRIHLDRTGDLTGSGIETIELPVCDQFTIQTERFAAAIRGGGGVAYPLEQSVRNMRLIDAVRQSAKTGRWSTGSSVGLPDS
ncbi:MAG TPA: Gfo/Idh/MocA family oxidoreductase [Vicinamibacterales bacterium]|nr:Gfo/Idh/MocA family oxidoreductase [Vicinamibacterales bacterium]